MINNIPQINPIFRTTFAPEDNQNFNKSNDFIYNYLENEEKLFESLKFKNKNCNDLKSEENYNCLNKNEDFMISQNNINYNVNSLLVVNNQQNTNINLLKTSKNLIKSIPKNPAALQNNITFSNYGLFMSNKLSNNQAVESSISFLNNTNTIANNFICQYCNCLNNIINNNNLNSSQCAPPFKLANKPTENLISNNNNLSNSPLKILLSGDKNYNKDSASKADINTKKYSEIILNDIIIEKSPDKDLISNLKKSKNFKSGKVKMLDFNNINSISNASDGMNNLNITTPNNFKNNFNINNLLTSEKEKFTMKGKYDVLRQSAISNTTNFKMNDEILCISELRILRKENLLYRNCFDAMSNELNNFKFNEKNKEEALEKFYDENRIIFEKEVTCFWKALKVYKEIFVDQIKNKENQMFEMSKVFDDMVIGENSNFFNNNLNIFNNSNMNNIGSKLI